MKIGFYEHINMLKRNSKHIIYVYCTKPFEAVDVVTGECSNYWNIGMFVFCENQEEMIKKWDWIFEIDIVKDEVNEHINS